MVYIRQLADYGSPLLNLFLPSCCAKKPQRYRIDLIVEGKVIIELKSVEALNEIHIAQVLTYLKLSGCKLGLLMNFNVLRVVDGIKRLANKL